MRYIVNKDNKVMGTIEKGNVNLDDLKSRGERIIEGDSNIPINLAIVENGKIVQRELTPEEIELQKKIQEAFEEFQKKTQDVTEPKSNLNSSKKKIGKSLKSI